MKVQTLCQNIPHATHPGWTQELARIGRELNVLGRGNFYAQTENSQYRMDRAENLQEKHERRNRKQELRFDLRQLEGSATAKTPRSARQLSQTSCGSACSYRPSCRRAAAYTTALWRTLPGRDRRHA